MTALSKPKVFALRYIILLTLSCVFVFAAVAEFGMWGVGTLPGVVFALWVLKQRQNRILLAVSYALLAIAGLAISHYYPGEAGADNRVVMFVATLSVIGFTLVRIDMVELGEA